MPRSSVLRSLAAFSICLLLSAAPAAAQKKALTQDTYDRWRTVQAPVLSPDGAWAAWTESPAVGDGEAVLRSAEGGEPLRIPRGFTGRPELRPNADSGFTADPVRFTADSRHLVLLAYPTQAEVEQAQRARRNGAAAIRTALVLVRIGDRRVTRIPDVRGFRVAPDGGRWLAYQLEDSAEARPAGSGAARGDSAPATPRRPRGQTLVLRDLDTDAETRIAHVTGYAMDDSARRVVYAVGGDDSTQAGVFVRELATGTVGTLATGFGRDGAPTIDRAGRQVAFLSDRGLAGDDTTRRALFHAALGRGAAVRIVVPAEGLDGLPVSGSAAVRFTRDGGAILFGVAPPPADSIPRDSLADKAVVDLWHWRDERLQPQQIVEARRDRRFAYDAIFHVRQGRARRLADDTLRSVTVSDDGRIGLAVTRVPYAVEAMWGAGGSDVWVIDAVGGRRTRVAEKVPFGAQLSPGGRWVTWFDGSQWWAAPTTGGPPRSLTARLADVRFAQEDWDTPSTPAPYGLGGWTTDDRSVLVYDRFDVWELDPAGTRAPRMVTDSAGRKARVRLRVVELDPEARFVDPRMPLVLSAFDEQSRASGFWRDRLDAVAAPEVLVMADVRFGRLAKAKDAERFLVTRQTVAESPDVWVGGRLDALTRLSSANPQQGEYRWPTVELVRWQSQDGVPLDGLLYKPEDFDPSKRYPLVVYYYEKLSDNLHQYHAPAGRNVVNPSVYASLGYLVFLPDIHYELGWPGPSAVKSIIPGVQSLIARGFVDPARLGIAGQSWGGYQTAYLITQSTLFAAAVPNAPVANMTSAYGGIRWESGLARPFQYEKQQSRIGGSLWEQPVRFIENSPLFHLDRVTTPVLFMHNDGDGAVPWYNGIELFVGLRRLGKEVYLLNYNGDGHNPRKRANQKDIDMRMQQFFAHHLLGEPAPRWMREGIRHLDKGRDQLGAGRATQDPATGRWTEGAAPR